MCYAYMYMNSLTLKFILFEPVPFFEYNLTFPIMCEKNYAEEDFKTAIAIAEESPVIVKQIEFQNQLASIEKQNSQKNESEKIQEPK